MKRAVTCLLTVLMMVALISGCGSTGSAQPAASSQTSVAAESEESYKIGVSVPSMEYTFFAQMETAINDMYPKDGVEVTVYDGENNQEKQNKDVEDIVTMGYDGIVLIPITVEGAVPAISYANEHDVPVITVDREVTADAGVDVIGFVGADHVDMGKQAGTLLVDTLEKMFPDAPTWNVIELEGTQGASATLKRGEGIHEVLDANDRVNVMASMDGNFSTTEALSIAEDMLTAHSDLNAFICHNDDMAMGCYQALVNANKVGQVAIIGIDGTLSCVQTIADGGIQGTVIQYPAMVTLGVDTLVAHIKGETTEYYNYYPTEPIPADQAQAFIDAGKPY